MVRTIVSNFQALEIIMIIIRQFVRLHPRRMKLDFQVCFRVVDRARHRKNSWRQGLTKTKLVDEVGKGAVCWFMWKRKNWENLRKRKSWRKLKTFHVEARKKGFIQCIIKQFSIRFGFCDIQNNQGLGKAYQPQPSASADNPFLDLDYLDIT